MESLKLRADFMRNLPATPNPKTKQLADSANLTVLVGTFASGRNAIVDALVKRGDYHFVISDTTRAPRIVNGQEERDGTVYWFKTEEEVLERLKKGMYIEAAIIHDKQVSGISSEELERAAAQDKIAIAEIETVGAMRLMETLPKTLFIFIVPPDYETWMDRANKRGTMDQDERRKRLQSAEKELQAAINRSEFLVVVNDELESAVDEVDRLIQLSKAGRIDEYTRGEDIDELLWRLLNDVKKELSS